jgi:hypothetical protein
MCLTRRDMLLGLTLGLAVRRGCARDIFNKATHLAVPPRRILTGEEIGALFERPQTVAQLVRNLKIASDADLLLQPAFAEAANLMKFFNGTAVSRVPATSPADEPYKEVVTSIVTVDQTVFPGMQAKVEQGRRGPSGLFPRFAKAPPNAPTYGIMDVLVAQLQAFDVGLVRATFGPATKMHLKTDELPHGLSIYGNVKGIIDYNIYDTDPEGRSYDDKGLHLSISPVTNASDRESGSHPSSQSRSIVDSDRIETFREYVSQH